MISSGSSPDSVSWTSRSRSSSRTTADHPPLRGVAHEGNAAMNELDATPMTAGSDRSAKPTRTGKPMAPRG